MATQSNQESLDEVERLFWRTFRRVLGDQHLEPGAYATADLKGWDSLRHIELMFELEEAFEVSIQPEDINGLYSDTDTLIEFLRRQGSR